MCVIRQTDRHIYGSYPIWRVVITFLAGSGPFFGLSEAFLSCLSGAGPVPKIYHVHPINRRQAAAGWGVIVQLSIDLRVLVRVPMVTGAALLAK